MALIFVVSELYVYTREAHLVACAHKIQGQHAACVFDGAMIYTRPYSLRLLD